jgi:hypothetical protein
VIGSGLRGGQFAVEAWLSGGFGVGVRFFPNEETDWWLFSTALGWARGLSWIGFRFSLGTRSCDAGGAWFWCF